MHCQALSLARMLSLSLSALHLNHLQADLKQQKQLLSKVWRVVFFVERARIQRSFLSRRNHVLDHVPNHVRDSSILRDFISTLFVPFLLRKKRTASNKLIYLARWDLGFFFPFHIFNSQFCDVAEVEIVPSSSLPFRCGVGPSDWQEDYGPRFPMVWIWEAAAAGWCSSAGIRGFRAFAMRLKDGFLSR
jgi:hypothetical protein